MAGDGRKSSVDTAAGRDRRGRFGPGNPGRRKGSRNRTTLAAEKLLAGEAEALTRQAVEMALGGDTTALGLCLARIIPPARERALRLPREAAENDIGRALAAVMQEAASGTLTLGEAGQAMQLIAQRHRLADLGELLARLEVLEERKVNQNG